MYIVYMHVYLIKGLSVFAKALVIASSRARVCRFPQVHVNYDLTVVMGWERNELVLVKVRHGMTDRHIFI
jgi:hypothetical protein